MATFALLLNTARSLCALVTTSSTNLWYQLELKNLPMRANIHQTNTAIQNASLDRHCRFLCRKSSRQFGKVRTVSPFVSCSPMRRFQGPSPSRGCFSWTFSRLIVPEKCDNIYVRCSFAVSWLLCYLSAVYSLNLDAVQHPPSLKYLGCDSNRAPEKVRVGKLRVVKLEFQ